MAMVSERAVELCRSAETVSSALAASPEESPGQATERLYGRYAVDRARDPPRGQPDSISTEELEAIKGCGRWGGTTPSDLFLRAFGDAIACLDADPLASVVSPPLMGTHGTIPLTVIAPLADIIRHCTNAIVRAEKEVFFVTCSWAPSVAQRLIRNAFIELSRRAGIRGQRVVVKLMYDKAGPWNVVETHQTVSAAGYTAKSIQLPAPEEIPNLDFEVTNLHKFVLGTLHAKFCVVDRKVAIVMSNNIEDNDNMEMMTHLTGPIVDSIYDTALITWKKSLNPPLPSLRSSLHNGSLSAGNGNDEPQKANGYHRSPDEIAQLGHLKSHLPEHTPEDPHYDDTIEDETTRMQACYSAKQNESRLQAANRLLNVAVKTPAEPSGPDITDGNEMTPYISTITPQSAPMAVVSRPPFGPLGTKHVYVPQNEAWLSLIRNAKERIFIQTPDLNASPLLEAIVQALGRGVEVTYYVSFGYNDPGEMIPGQGGTNEQAAQALLGCLPVDGPERKLLHIHDYVGKDQVHPIHQSFKQRSCHVKLLIADGSVGVQGSGNQDTQSWYHSQELNIMVDSPQICQLWREGIERNQNTKVYGAVASDGVWRDLDGNARQGYMGNPGKVEGLAKGVVGMIKKIQGIRAA